MSEVDGGHRQQPLLIGLTGGIGSGKSAVAREFSALGIEVIDTDQLARELVEPGQPALADICALFGADCLHPDGTLDRDRVRRHIFNDPTLKQRLEAILHPRIWQRVTALVTVAHGPYVIIAVPLLLETGQTGRVDRILVVDAPEKERRKRVAERDGLSHNEISRIMAAQADRDMQVAAADDIIVNDRDLVTLRNRVRELHQHYLGIAHADQH